MRQSSVPTNFDEFYAKYSRFVVWAIGHISKGRTRPQDLPDLTQMIYLRICEKNYLERCRQLIAERGTGQFTTYLFWLIRSVLVNEYRVNTRNPLNMAYHLLDQREHDGMRRASRRAPFSVAPHGRALRGRFTDAQQETRANLAHDLERFARYVETTKRGVRLARTLQSVYEGRTTAEIVTRTGVPASRIVQARRELRQLADATHLRDHLAC